MARLTPPTPAGRAGADRGQASVELVAIVPALAVAVLIVVQIVLAGHALWAAGIAARAGARAAQVGGDVASVARHALPPSLRRGARIDAQGPVGVHVRIPLVIPGLPTVGVQARAALGVGDDG